MTIVYHVPGATPEHVAPGIAFTLAGKRFPANWLEHACPADLSAIGAVPCAVEGAHGDPRRYVNTVTHDGPVVRLTAAPRSAADLMAALRQDRDARLAKAIQVLDRHRNQQDFGLGTTLTEVQAAAWAAYAQALRDMPASTADPLAPDWPDWTDFLVR